MNNLENSFIINSLKSLNINDSSVQKELESSVFVGKFNQIFGFLQNLFSNLLKDSFLIKNIDLFILGLLSLLLTLLTFASTGIIGLLIMVSFALTVIKFLSSDKAKPAHTAFNVPVFLYFGIALVSVFFSWLLLPSLKGFSKMLIYLSAYLTFLNIFKDSPNKLKYVLFFLATTVSLEAFYAICQQITGVEALASWQDLTDTNPEDLMNRVYGTLKPFNPNLLAGYLVAGFPAVLGTAFIMFRKKILSLSIISGASVLAVLAAIVFTGSRGAYMAMAAMLLLFVAISGHIIWHDYKEKQWLKNLWLGSIAAFVIGIILMIAVTPALQHRIASIFAFRGDSSNSYRFNVYAASFKMFLDNALIGIGPGNTTFRLMYGLYMVTGFDALGTYCVPLEIAVESGIFALLTFGWLILMVFMRGISCIMGNNCINSKIISAVCIMSITGMMIHGMVDTVWYRPQIQVIFWLIISMIAVITTEKAKHE